MVLGTPQIIYLVLEILSLGFVLAKHGQARTGKYNFGHPYLLMV